MVDSFSSIGYVPLRNNIDFSVGNSPLLQPTDNLGTLPLLNEIKPKDNTTFNVLKSAAFLIDPLRLFSHLPELPNISIFSNIFPKNNAASYESIRNGNGSVGLSLGQVGPSVRTLQKTLTQLGYTVRESGTFDIYTQTALKRFQDAHKIEQTGILGKTTLSFLDKASQVDQKPVNRGLSAVNKYMNPDNVSKFHYNQYSGLASQNGDCGPSVVKMLLKANGIDKTVPQIRQVSGVTRSRGGAWAISEGEIAQSVNRLSNGRIREVDRQTFNPLNHGKFINYVKSELDKGRMPILLTGNSGTGRHYTVIVGVKPDGSILVADSILRTSQNDGISTYSANNMRRRMATSLLSGGTHVMSFAKS